MWVAGPPLNLTRPESQRSKARTSARSSAAARTACPASRAARRGPGGVLVVELAEQVVDESTYRGWLADDFAELSDASPAVHDRHVSVRRRAPLRRGNHYRPRPRAPAPTSSKK